MEHAIRIHVEALPAGVFLATSNDVPGLVAQGRTVAETLEIARDVARKRRHLGFYFDRQAPGSHILWFHLERNLYTVLPNHSGDIPEGTLRAILNRAGIEADDFLGS